MNPRRRHTPEVSPEQFDELEQSRRVEISDGNGRRAVLVPIEAMLDRTQHTRALFWQTVVLLMACGVAIWKASQWYGDLVHRLDQRTIDRWPGAAEQIAETARAQKWPEYAKCALTATEIRDIQSVVMARTRTEE